MKLFNAFPHAQQLKAPLQLSCKRHGQCLGDAMLLVVSTVSKERTFRGLVHASML